MFRELKALFLDSFWRVLLPLSFLAGVLLRMIYPEDMEFKEDEHYNFIQTQLIGTEKPWPWIGMPSGVYIPNPGLSIWIFYWLARLGDITTPIGLVHAVQIVSILGIALLLPFSLRFIQGKQRTIWLWAFALAFVNPFAVYYQRKLWPEPLLPLFSMIMILGWWLRGHFWGAFVWGLVGILLGQIHMSGFFFSAGIAMWTAFWKPKAEFKVWIKPWIAGTVLGALPLIPWLFIVCREPLTGKISSGIVEMVQLKFWVFWITDTLGLTLGNPLGLHLGNQWQQIQEFIKYPLININNGFTSTVITTYINGLAHFLILLSAIMILGFSWIRFLKHFFLKTFRKQTSDVLPSVFSPYDETRFLCACGFYGFGTLLTLTGVNIRRYYMMVSFPLEFLWLIQKVMDFQETQPHRPKFAHRILLGIWICELIISICFVNFIHRNSGAPQGDYGHAYHVIIKEHIRVHGVPWQGFRNHGLVKK